MINPRYIQIMAISLFSLLLVGATCIAPADKAKGELVIYDVHADSPRIVKEDGTIEFADYVRIKNLTDHPYDLSGLYLSDNRKNLRKLSLDGVVIDSNDSVMIRLDPSWNFALRQDGGECVYLSGASGNVLYEYKPSMKPAPPKLSADSGFYEKEFELLMTGVDGAMIYYTLDGNEPNENSMVYKNPIRVYDRSSEPNTVVNVPNTIKNYYDTCYTDSETGYSISVEQPIEEPVDKAFVIRAVAIDEYGNKSDIVTKEYFFCGSKYKNVMSIVADRNDLFGDYGILSTGKEYDEWYLNDRVGDEPGVNYIKSGRDWEVTADMHYYRNGRSVLNQKCGLRLQGRTTRYNRIKNFQIRARNCYSGSDVFEYNFFDNENYRSDAVILDDSFPESFFLSLVEGEDIIKQKTTDRVALFVNGEFWNNIYIHQKLDERYYMDHLGINDENFFVLSESFVEIGDPDGEMWENDEALYAELHDFAANNDLTLDRNYETIQSMMDIDNYIEYLAINTWTGNTDWGEFENDLVMRVREPDDSLYGDGRFRWILHDGDESFNLGVWATDISYVRESALYNNLMKNKDVKQRFIDRLVELGNTSFSENNIQKELNNPKWDEPEKQSIKYFFEKRRSEITEKCNSLFDDDP